MNKNILNILKITLSTDSNILFAYLFGSTVKHKIRYGSDLDVAIYFNEEPHLNEIGMLNLNLEEKSNHKIDLVQLNRLEKVNPVLAYSIIDEGILLINTNNDLLNKYKVSAILQYLDFKPANDLVNEGFTSRLMNKQFAVFEK